MASLNKVILLGNLTRDPELRYAPNGTPVARFGLAVNTARAGQGDECRPPAMAQLGRPGRPEAEQARGHCRTDPIYAAGA